MFNKNEWAYILKWSKKIKAINLLGGKCSCGEDRPWLLNFHHKNPEKKEFKICDIFDRRWSLIEKEITKCILLCYNCHRELHSNNLIETTRTYSKKAILDISAINGCEECGYNKCNNSLDFHHKDSIEKEFNLSEIRVCEKSFQELKNEIIKEITKCNIYCANCHHDLHFDNERFEQYKDQIYNYNIREQQEPLDIQLITDMYNSGIKQTDISKKLKCAKSTVCGIIKKFC